MSHNLRIVLCTGFYLLIFFSTLAHGKRIKNSPSTVNIETTTFQELPDTTSIPNDVKITEEADNTTTQPTESTMTPIETQSTIESTLDNTSTQQTEENGTLSSSTSQPDLFTTSSGFSTETSFNTDETSTTSENEYTSEDLLVSTSANTEVITSSASMLDMDTDAITTPLESDIDETTVQPNTTEDIFGMGNNTLNVSSTTESAMYTETEEAIEEEGITSTTQEMVSSLTTSDIMYNNNTSTTTTPSWDDVTSEYTSTEDETNQTLTQTTSQSFETTSTTQSVTFNEEGDTTNITNQTITYINDINATATTESVYIIETNSSLTTDLSNGTTSNPAGLSSRGDNDSWYEGAGGRAGLIACLVTGCVFTGTIIVLVTKRCYDGYQKRHYTRMDYLINGMYN